MIVIPNKVGPYKWTIVDLLKNRWGVYKHYKKSEPHQKNKKNIFLTEKKHNTKPLKC